MENVNFEVLKLLKKFIIKLKGLFPVKLKTFFKKFRKFNAYHNLDKQMIEYINFKNGFYIDCGANDGVNQSTTWYFEKYLNWNGILIEPITSVFDELKRNRSNKNIFKNCVLVGKDFKEKKIKFYYNDKDTLTGSVKKKENLKQEHITAMTLNKLLNDLNFNKVIDLFSLDVEGNEFEVINGIDFKKFKINYFLIETNSFDKLNEILKRQNFKFVKRLSNYSFADRPDYGDYLFKSI